MVIEIDREGRRQRSTGYSIPASIVYSNVPSIACLLFTSAHRSCFRTWLPVKLVSVTKVVNQNIQGYRFNPSHFTAYKKIFCLTVSRIYVLVYIRNCLRLYRIRSLLNSFVISIYQKLTRYRLSFIKFLKIVVDESSKKIEVAHGSEQSWKRRGSKLY